jgi:hypothetical protein
MAYTTDQVAKAIDQEALDWAALFEVTDATEIEGRRQVMRANFAAGYYAPLRSYLTVSTAPREMAYVVEYKDSPKAKWKASTFGRRYDVKGEAISFARSMDEQGCCVCRVVILPSREVVWTPRYDLNSK